MSSRKNVPASVVRDWANENPGEFPAPGSRGRLHPETIAAFHKANRGKRYETASEAEKATVTVPVKMLDSIGRATTRQVTVTTESARALLGQTGRKGRFDRGLLSLALEAEALAA